MRKDDFIGNQFYWFTGEVKKWEENNRVRVFCHGYHPDNLHADGQEDKLPSATVMMPTTIGGTSNTAANHQLEKGSWVVGFFRDGSSAQDPIIMGSIAGPDDASGTDDKKVYEFHGHKTEINKSGGDILVSHKSGSSIKMLESGQIIIQSALGQKLTIV